MDQDCYNWSTSRTEELIDRYRSLRELWDVSFPSYRNRWKKRKAWKLLADIFATTEHEVRRKMHNIRSQFSQEVRMNRTSWYFYRLLEFLREGPTRRDYLSSKVNYFILINN